MGGTYRVERCCAGTEELISIESNGHLYLLALLSYVLYLTIRVLRELLPESYSVTEQPV